MSVLYVILRVVTVILSLLLTLLILMHKGKDGGLSQVLGADSATSGVAEKNLNRWTVIVSLVWVVAIIVLDFYPKMGW